MRFSDMKPKKHNTTTQNVNTLVKFWDFSETSVENNRTWAPKSPENAREQSDSRIIA